MTSDQRPNNTMTTELTTLALAALLQAAQFCLYWVIAQAQVGSPSLYFSLAP